MTCTKYAVGRDHVTEAVVVVAQELGEVVQQDEQDAQGAAVQTVHRLGQLCVPQEGRQELEQSGQKVREHRTALLLRRLRQDLPDEHPVGDDLEPGVGEARSLN